MPLVINASGWLGRFDSDGEDNKIGEPTGSMSFDGLGGTTG